MSRDVLPLYGGAIRANKIGSFVLDGETFHVVRPGYCTQGRRRTTWTQIVHEDVPVFAMKVQTDLTTAIQRFEALWNQHLAGDPEVLAKALSLCKAARRRKFRDGVTGESPAPAASLDGTGPGVRYPA